MIQGAEIIGTGLATTELIGAGVGIEVVLLGSVLLILLALLSTSLFLITSSKVIQHPVVPARKCPSCAKKGQVVWVIPGKRCVQCGTQVN